MALAHCILCKFLGVVCHCFPPPLDVPTFSARCLHVQWRERPVAVEGGTLRGWEMFRQISSRIRLPRNSRDLLRAAYLRHGTDAFTSPLKEGVLRIFSPLKIRRLRPGLNPRTWVPKASTLPLDHRSQHISCAKKIRIFIYLCDDVLVPHAMMRGYYWSLDLYKEFPISKYSLVIKIEWEVITMLNMAHLTLILLTWRKWWANNASK